MVKNGRGRQSDAWDEGDAKEEVVPNGVGLI